MGNRGAGASDRTRAVVNRLGGCVFGGAWRLPARAAVTAIASPRTPLTRLVVGGAVGASMLLGAPSALAAGSGSPVNTALPVISGTARDGSTIYTAKGKWSGTATINYAYQWQLCDSAGENCANIVGAVKASYKLIHEDVGRRLRSVVKATNGEGSASATAAPSAVIATLKPSKGKAPTISGVAKDGQLLKSSSGTWKGTPPFNYAYQWKVCAGTSCTPITGADEPTYRPTTSQIGMQMRVAVTASNSAGSGANTSTGTKKVVAGPPVNTTPPAVSGVPVDGQTLSADPGTWAGTGPFAYAYEWLSCSVLTSECAPIPGATSSTYTAGPLDVANELEVVVTATGSHGIASATSPKTSAVGALVPSNTGLPSITGILHDGQLLSAVVGEWSGTPPISYEYVWQLCNAAGEACKDIAGGVEPALQLVSGDVGSTVRVLVTATNAGGSSQVASQATSLIGALLPSNISLPSIAGVLTDGQLLSAATGEWSGSGPISYAYQWQLCDASGEACKDISGAVEPTLELLSGDVGSTVRVLVKATNSGGSTEVASKATSVIGALLPSNVSLPSIAGVLTDGQLLSAATGEWSGTAPISYAYKWQLCNASGEACKDISGAVEPTLELLSGDVGSTVRVLVKATNSGGSTEVASKATSLIGALLPSNTSLPSVGGSLLDGQTLTASNGSWEGTTPISYGYQWLQCNSAGEGCKEISGATAGTLGLVSSLVGDTVKVVVKATNSGGSTEATSTASGVIAALLPKNTELPSISGVLEDAKTLSASTGAWSGTTPISYSYQWEQCNGKGGECKELTGATGATLGLVSTLVGDTVKVVVKATNSGGSTEATSAASGVILALLPKDLSLPSISSSTKELEQGATAKGTTGSWEGTSPTFSYQWKTCNSKGEECTNLAAKEETLAVGESLVTSTLRLAVKATNSRGSTEALSAPTSAVLAALPVNEVQPVIKGVLELGKELTALPEKWAGTKATEYTYQWQLCGVLGLVSECKDIAGATKETFLLELLDVGLTMRVGVTAHNERGASEVAYSKVTGLIAKGLGLSPIKGAAGTNVTVKGMGVNAATIVNFGETEVFAEPKSSTEVVASAPSGGSGTVPVTVSTPEGTTHETPNTQFTFVE